MNNPDPELDKEQQHLVRELERYTRMLDTYALKAILKSTYKESKRIDNYYQDLIGRKWGFKE